MSDSEFSLDRLLYARLIDDPEPFVIRNFTRSQGGAGPSLVNGVPVPGAVVDVAAGLHITEGDLMFTWRELFVRAGLITD